jgi:hypothetical protein
MDKLIAAQQLMVTALAEALIAAKAVERDKLVSALGAVRDNMANSDFEPIHLVSLDQLIQAIGTGPVAVH